MASAMGTLRRPIEIISRGHGGFERLVGGDGAEQAGRRQQELQRRRNEFHCPGHPHAPEAER